MTLPECLAILVSLFVVCVFYVIVRVWREAAETAEVIAGLVEEASEPRRVNWHSVTLDAQDVAVLNEFNKNGKVEVIEIRREKL